MMKIDEDVAKIIDEAVDKFGIDHELYEGDSVQTPYTIHGHELEGKCIAIRQKANGDKICTVALEDEEDGIKVEAYVKNCYKDLRPIYGHDHGFVRAEAKKSTNEYQFDALYAHNEIIRNFAKLQEVISELEDTPSANNLSAYRRIELFADSISRNAEQLQVELEE